MFTLTQFVFRLAFGLALAMALTSPRQVTSGYFRVHLYVVLGLGTLAAMVALAVPERYALGPPVVVAVLSYVGSVVWLYERASAGRIVLLLIAAAAIIGAWQAQGELGSLPLAGDVLVRLDPVGGGLVLGSAMAAMLLGHWYLNTPTMELAPLQRLVKLLAVAVAFRMLLSLAGLGMQFSALSTWSGPQLSFLALRWLAGHVATLGLAWMTWQTLKVPNTQSATGMLYVCVITTFLGELTAQLLSAELPYPV